jgi:hypothetical protein
VPYRAHFLLLRCVRWDTLPYKTSVPDQDTNRIGFQSEDHILNRTDYSNLRQEEKWVDTDREEIDPEQCNPIQQTRRVSVQYSLLTVGPLLPPPIDQWLRASLQTQRHSIGAASLSFALSTRPVVGSLALLLPPLFFLPWDRIADR